MKGEKQGLAVLHTSVFLMSLSGLFAKWLDLPPTVIVFWRVVFSSLCLLLFLKLRKEKMRPACRKDCLLLMTAGAVLVIHWTTFMQSIQTSTVAIGTLTFSTFPLFVTFLEPVLFKEKLKMQRVISAAVMLAGVLFIVPRFEVGNSMTVGILWGMAGSLSYAVLSLMNRKFMEQYSSTLTAFYEQATASILLFPVLFFSPQRAQGRDFLILLMLGMVFTAVAHTLYIESLRYVKVQTAGIVSGMESVYSIAAAFFLLKETPSIRELIGGSIILGVVFYSSIRSVRKEFGDKIQDPVNQKDKKQEA